jgi:hypothetical protein
LGRVNQRIEPGFQVYAGEGVDAVGGVRQLRGRDLVVDIEGAGDFVIPRRVVAAVHDQKVILDIGMLDEDVRKAIAHAHDLEGTPL